MKSSHAVFFFLAGIFGVWVGGLFFGLFWDMYISGKLEVGDVATWAAAFGTICTLGFLINQHKQIHNEQKKEKIDRKRESSQQQNALREERKKRESHERQQKEMWNEQREMLVFQKYLDHKKQFLDHINHFEATLKGKVTFVDTITLYKLLFPQNNFSNCICIYSSKKDSTFINDITHLYENIDKSIRSKGIDEQQLIRDMFEICRLLHIQVGQREFGTIRVEDLYIDYFEPLKTLEVIKFVIYDLMTFCNLPVTDFPYSGTQNIRIEWLKAMNRLIEPKTISHHKLMLNNSHQLIRLFLHAHCSLWTSSINNEIRYKLTCHLNSSESCLKFLQDENLCYDLITEIQHAFRALASDEQHSEYEEVFYLIASAALLLQRNEEFEWEDLPKNESQYVSLFIRSY